MTSPPRPADHLTDILTGSTDALRQSLAATIQHDKETETMPENDALKCLAPDCLGHVRGYCDESEGGPAVTVSVAITGTRDYEGWKAGSAIAADDWRVESVADDDNEWSISVIRCDTCQREYTSEALAAAYPDRYTPDTEDEDDA